MRNSEMSRRAFVGAVAVAPLARAEAGWIELFDGRSLRGWRASENQASWKVVDGQLSADGPRSHLFYTGPAHGANFRNFELEVEVMSRPGREFRGLLPHCLPGDGFPAKGLRGPGQ